MTIHTKLWIREQGPHSPRRLMNEIHSYSRFTTMPWFNRLNNATDEDIMKATKEQRDGWKFNGPFPNAEFEIEVFNR